MVRCRTRALSNFDSPFHFFFLYIYLFFSLSLFFFMGIFLPTGVVSFPLSLT